MAYENLLLSQCDGTESIVLRRSAYANLVGQSIGFIQRFGSFHLHNVTFDDFGGIATPLDPHPWIGTYSLDQFKVPEGSVLDVTSIIFSMRIDPTFPASTRGFHAYRGATPPDADAAFEAEFSEGITADDHYLDPDRNRFWIRVNKNTPFTHGYLRRDQNISWGLFDDSDPDYPPPVGEDLLSRYSGVPVLNRNALAIGDLNFHLIARENQDVEFFFQTNAVAEGTYPAWVPGVPTLATPAVAIPKADVIVEWAGRLIPKTVFEEVIKANQ